MLLCKVLLFSECRHFLTGACRLGSSCNFLHPGVNGPPLDKDNELANTWRTPTDQWVTNTNNWPMINHQKWPMKVLYWGKKWWTNAVSDILAWQRASDPVADGLRQLMEENIWYLRVDIVWWGWEGGGVYDTFCEVCNSSSDIGI